MGIQGEHCAVRRDHRKSFLEAAKRVQTIALVDSKYLTSLFGDLFGFGLAAMSVMAHGAVPTRRCHGTGREARSTVACTTMFCRTLNPTSEYKSGEWCDKDGRGLGDACERSYGLFTALGDQKHHYCTLLF